jgi:hypothetical protein
MKTYKEILENNIAIKLKRAKTDQEIYDRLQKLKDAGIKAFSSAEASTHILVNKPDAVKARKILNNILDEE